MTEPGEAAGGPEVVSQGIVDLTNQTFDRLSGRLAIYAADGRRDRAPEGTTLTADNENVLWEGGAYGRMRIEIARKESEIRVAQAFIEDPFINAAILDPEVSHHSFLQSRLLKDVASEEDVRRFSPQGYILLLDVLRDRYPRGVPEVREPIRAGQKDVGQYPEDSYGERHRVGFGIIARYDDRTAPERPLRWDFGVSAQTRFDKPEPQVEVVSNLRYGNQIDAEEDPAADLTEGEDMVFGAKKKRTQPATLDTVTTMEELFGLAKDIRPLVTGIRKLLRERAEFDRFLVSSGAERFFARPEAEATSAPV